MQASSVNQIMMVVPTLSPNIIIIPIIGAKQMVKIGRKTQWFLGARLVSNPWQCKTCFTIPHREATSCRTWHLCDEQVGFL